MGGNRTATAAIARATYIVVVAIALGVAAGACGSDDTTATSDVEPAAAYTAIVEWQAGEQEPVTNDNGEAQLPVIYVVAADGETIDVGVQADVAAATVDIADVRFADESTEAFHDGVDGEPVIADGVMLLVGALPDPAPTINVELLRYLTIESSSPFTLQITADEAATESSGISVATVTSVTEP